MPRALDAIVTGDITLDWHFVRLATPGALQGQGADNICVAVEHGGAQLLSGVMGATAEALRAGGGTAAVVHHAVPPEGGPRAADPDRHHTFIEWMRQGNPPAWRVARLMGRQAMRNPSGHVGAWQRVADEDVTAGLHVINDGGLGFRERPELWPRVTPSLAWIVLKMARPVLTGPLWAHVCAHSDRLVVIVNADDLRAAQAQISADSSWERTAQDLVWEVAHNPRLSALAACAHVIVSFGPVGALWIDRQPPGHGRAVLFFDPAGVEHHWPGQLPGGMIGSTTCLAAAVATTLMRNMENPDIGDGVRRGITAMRALHVRGYAASPADAPSAFGFPIGMVADELMKDDAPRVAETPVRDPMVPGASAEEAGAAALWSILEETVGVGFDALAKRIVLDGPEQALENVPVARFGQLVAVDRREIECFRNVAGLIGKYAAEQQKKPLSIGVFGAPGSGKSFGVTEVAGSLLPGRMQTLEFNLSQLDGVPALRGAFHQIRDITLSGRLPLVFWDEFDCVLDGQPFGWLRHFLAPMQDGKFLDGQIAHPTGRAIFVFAGGTASSRSEFGRNVDPQVFRNAKGPDFASRLPASIDVMGPNPGIGDPYYVIRRALLLRSLLKRHAPGCVDQTGRLRIDPGVLRAFLDTRRFTHGARSMETVVLTSQLAGLDSYDRSALPAEAMLEPHVNSRGFMALVHQLDLAGDTLERLAEVAHRVFIDMTTDRGDLTHSSMRPFMELPEDEKEQNRDLVRDIPRKLAMAGYLVVAARGTQAPFAFPADDLERLAEIEHERWVRLKVAQGWRHAPGTDKARKLHSALVAWSGLPEAERDKDREIVAAFPRILAAAGYTVAREGSL